MIDIFQTRYGDPLGCCECGEQCIGVIIGGNSLENVSVAPYCGCHPLAEPTTRGLIALKWATDKRDFVTGQLPVQATGVARPTAQDASPCSMISVWRPFE